MRLLLRILLSLAAAALAFAAETRLDFDAAQSTVEFTVSDPLHTVHGDFKLRQGSLRFDPSSMTVSGQIVVDAGSGESGSNGRDSRMHKNVLESMRFPDVVFVPAHFTGDFHPDADSQLTVYGTFKLHGADHEIDVPVQVHPSGGSYVIDARFPVPYVKWGLKNPSNFLLHVGDTVAIKVHATARVVP
jgi:polyisoprenoid-binding protein YceI